IKKINTICTKYNMEDIYEKIKDTYKAPKIVLKYVLSKPKLFEYLFFHKPLIKKWNVKFNVLKIHFIPFMKISILPDFKEKFDNIFQKNVYPIMTYLKLIIREGWKWDFISVRDYNLIVLFLDLCVKMEFIKNSNSIKNFHFFKMEETFLKIVNSKDNVQSIVDSLKSLFEHSKKFDEEKQKEIDNMFLNIEFFFSKDYLLPSIYDLIIGYNIYTFKRILRWEDIYKKENISVIQTDFYDCTKDVFYEILNTISRLHYEYKKLNKEKEQLDWINSLKNLDNKNRADKIFYFYNSILKKDYDLEMQDILLFFINLTEPLIKHLDSFIYKEFDVLDNSQKMIKLKIVDKNPFDIVFQKINNDYYHLRAKYFSTVSFKVSVENFQKSDNPFLLFDEGQKVIYEKIQNITKLIYELALKLKRNIETDSILIKSNDRNKYMIQNPKEWRGKSVYEVTFFYIEVLIQTAIFFRDPQLESEIKSIAKLEKDINENRERFSKMVDAKHYIENMLEEKVSN
ncbi:MAG TPA: hypothetical protein PK771_12455, partial [Spirochaetota bacterium]|nr:hypothetical protein [Spirochaetota bacterium]